MQQEFKNRFIKDVIHNEIIFEQPWVPELLKAKEFLRLTRIKQLGLSYRLFPNATHTRYAHSLGVYALANQVANQLKIFTQQEINELVAAALIHDFGHGPHSHAFEEYTGINHEHYSKAIILDKKTEVNKILTKNKINIKHVCALLDHNHPNKYLNDLISSQVDVDRLDYLARDSYLTGVTYGHIDSSIIIKWLMIKDGQICFNYKAISSIENLLISRYHMFERVYEQPKTCALQQLIRKMVQRFKYLYTHKPNILVDKNKMSLYFKPWLTDQPFTVEEYLQIDDVKFEMFIEQMQFEKDSYILEAYKLYTKFINLDYKVIENTKDNLKKYTKQLSSKTKYPDLYIHKCRIKTKQIYKKDDQPIWIYDAFIHKLKKLEEVSPIVKKIINATKPQDVLVINNHI